MEMPALKAAVELTMMPSRVRLLRDAPLPTGVPLLLRIAAGDSEAVQRAAAAMERPANIIRESATFYIEQMLLHPDADSYRVLGASASAPASELRQNMALLMRWLHPDSAREEERAVFANRVNRAWDDLKTAERRSAYDSLQTTQATRQRPSSGSKKRSGSAGGGAGRSHQPAKQSRTGPHMAGRMTALPPARQRGVLWRALDLLLRPRR